MLVTPLYHGLYRMAKSSGLFIHLDVDLLSSAELQEIGEAISLSL